MKTMGLFLETASEKEAARIETTPSETVTADFAYGFIYIDEPIFGRSDTNDDGDFADAEEQFYYTTNNLYNVVAILDTSGNIIERYEYTPYGELTVYTDASSGTWWDGDETSGSLSGNYYSFTGRRSDPEADLMYYRNRYYSTELGRFVGRDPYISYLPLYDFVESRPSRFVDPLGLQSGGIDPYSDLPYGGSARYHDPQPSPEEPTSEPRGINYDDYLFPPVARSPVRGQSAEAGAIVSIGLVRATCCASCSIKWESFYLKICYGAFADFGANVSAWSSIDFEDCPKALGEDFWMIEGGLELGLPGLGGGIGVGPTGIAIGTGPAVGGGLKYCRYRVVYGPVRAGECN